MRDTGHVHQWASTVGATYTVSPASAKALKSLHAQRSVWRGVFVFNAQNNDSPPKSPPPVPPTESELPAAVEVPGLTLAHSAHKWHSPFDRVAVRYPDIAPSAATRDPSNAAHHFHAPTAFRIVHSCAIEAVPDMLRSEQVFELDHVGRNSSSGDDSPAERFLRWFPNTNSTETDSAPATTGTFSPMHHPSDNALVACAVLAPRNEAPGSIHRSEYDWMRSTIQRYESEKRKSQPPRASANSSGVAADDEQVRRNDTNHAT